MARTRTISVLDKVRDGRYRHSRDGAALCAEMGVDDPAKALALAREKLEIPRGRGGRPRKSLEQHRRQRTHPHYPRKPKTATPTSHGTRHPDWLPGVGHFPDVAAMLTAVDDAWDEKLDAEWPPEQLPYAACVSDGRTVARHAAAEWARHWRREWGPEYAAEQGVPADVIVDYLGRAPKPNRGEPYPPPTPADVRDALADGWLRRYWTRS